jgi:NAD(P)-dependent dehydrogenase (short-subunit alcohol dehydrogenase family)
VGRGARALRNPRSLSRSRIHAPRYSVAMRPEVLNKLTAPVPLERSGLAEEIAHAVRFIFENEFFTGRCLDVDGGSRL